LLYDEKTKSVPHLGAWVYTGSSVLKDGQSLAEMEGTLIGFVHDPDAIIENSTGGGLSAYGSIRLNPSFKDSADMPMKLILRAVSKPAEK
jgi:hypothetical protein